MNGILWAVLGVAIGIFAPFLFLRWRRGAAETGDTLPTTRAPPRPAASRDPVPGKASGATKRQPASKFHGVSVKAGERACEAVQTIADKRFLSEHAPPLPLASCDQQRCQCAYEHHSDRRGQDDRRSGWGTYGGFTPSVPGGNRRAKRGDRRRSQPQ